MVSRHALRNALLPAITVIGLEFTFLIGGLVVTEQVFNLNGIGKLFVQSVSRNDFTLDPGHGDADRRVLRVRNLVIDLLYAVFDPRIRLTPMTMASPSLTASPPIPRRRNAIVDFAGSSRSVR